MFNYLKKKVETMVGSDKPAVTDVEMQNRMAACKREVEAVLARYKCTLLATPTYIISVQPTPPTDPAAP